MSPVEALAEGKAILDPVLVPAGFGFVEGYSGKAHGGDVATGAYVRGARRLSFSIRYGLGLVTYHVGPYEIDHERYLRAMLGLGRSSAYPGAYPAFSSDDLVGGFRRLRSDLERYGHEFLHGPDGHFIACWYRARGLTRGLP